MSWSVRGLGHKEGPACSCGRPGIPARRLDHPGEAAGVAEIKPEERWSVFGGQWGALPGLPMCF